MKRSINKAAQPVVRRGRPSGIASAKPRAKAEHGTTLLTAFQEIRELIVHGKMAPGTWIVEADMAARLNMSRTPVRSAIHWLQREGYILAQRSITKSRMIVAPLTKDDANQLYMIIGHLEGIAGRGAAQMVEKDRKDLVKQLKSINDKLLAIADGNDPPGGIFDLDRAFHRLIVDAGAGARLATLHHAIEPQAERYWRLYASSIISDLHTSVQEHKQIIEGLSSGDSNLVERSLQDNWLRGSERLGHVIDIFGERGSW